MDTEQDGMRGLAVALARKGFRVFPLQVRGKRPVFPDWPNRATSYPPAVERMWTDPVSGEGQEWNIGVATGKGLVVVDIDMKNDKNGEAALAHLENLNGDLPATYTVATPNGRHLYFKLPPDTFVPNSSNKLGPGIDVRGDGGYVVGPGSIVIDIPYAFYV